MSISKEGAGILIGMALIAGCAKSPPPVFADRRPPPASQPAPESPFGMYVRASQLAESEGSRYIDRTTFTPGKKDEAIRLLQPALKLIKNAEGKEFDFAFQPTAPFEPRPHRKGWRLIGSAFVWQIENAVRDERFDEAAGLFLNALRFGLNLSGGSALDASLGYSIIDDARLALLPAVPQMDSKALEKLGRAIESALAASPRISQTLENEHSQMMAAVQSIQDAYLKGDFSHFRQELRADILPAIRHLEERKNRAHEVAEYFESLSKEADILTQHYMALGSMNARQRLAAESPKLSESRPWRRWARFFFRAPESLFTIRDRSLARTRLLALHALLRSRLKKSEPLPGNLSSISKSLAIDPFSGQAFVYRVAGAQYRLYSVGQDGKDNGGETEESFSTPDLLLESSDL